MHKLGAIAVTSTSPKLAHGAEVPTNHPVRELENSEEIKQTDDHRDRHGAEHDASEDGEVGKVRFGHARVRSTQDSSRATRFRLRAGRSQAFRHDPRIRS
jgi:hypothetical protein